MHDSNMKTIICFLQKHFFGQTSKILFVTCFSMVVALLSQSSVYISGKFVDFLTTTQNDMSTYKTLLNYSVLFVILNLTAVLINFAINRMVTILYSNTFYSITRTVSHHIQSISLYKEIKFNSSKITHQLQVDANEIVSFSLGIFQNFPLNTCKLLFSIIMLYFLSKSVLLIILLLVFVYVFFYATLKPKLFKSIKELKNVQSKFFSKLFEQIQFSSYVKRHGLLSSFINRLNLPFKSLYEKMLENQILQFQFSGIDSIILTIGQIMLFILGGYLVLSQKLSVGEFSVINLYFSSIITTIRYFYSVGTSFQNMRVSFNRIYEFLKIPCIENGSEAIDSIINVSIENLKIQFDSKIVISEFHKEFIQGKMYIIAGANGSGKSTLLHTMAGLYNDLYLGSIKYNNIDIRKLDMEMLRQSKIGFVEQDAPLIEGTILYNLYPSKTQEDYSANEILRAKEMVDIFGLHDRISKSCDGLNMRIDEKNHLLSGGERQKIAIIRELLKQPSLLLLDEPTASMDQTSAEILLNELNSIKKDVIVVITTHDERILSYGEEILYL